MPNYEKEELTSQPLDYEYDDGDVQDWYPEGDYWAEDLPDSLRERLEEQGKVCRICHSVINDDGTADDCAGECDRGISPILLPDQVLDFNR